MLCCNEVNGEKESFPALSPKAIKKKNEEVTALARWTSGESHSKHKE